MSQSYFSLVTTIGKIKLAQSAAGGGSIVISQFAIGDGNGAEVNPTAASTSLVREVWRTQVESVVTDPDNPSAVLVTAIIPTNAGGWWMREFGIFDQAGDMIAVAKPISQYKPTALEGQLEDIRYEFQIIIGENANVTLLVDPSILLASREWVQTRKIPMSQMMRLPWLPVISMTTTAPPVSPAQGDAYLVPNGATGVWAANVGRVAEWTGSAWSYSTPANGHGISLPDGRIFERIGGAYTEFLASRSWVGSRTSASTKLNRLPWLPVISMTTTVPPANPAQGDAYLVPNGAAGIWAANVGRIAEYMDGAWSYAVPVDGHGISLPDGRTFMRRAGVYTEYAATQTARGLIQIASPAEIIAGLDHEKAITSAGLAQGIGAYIGGDELTLWVRHDGNDANDGSGNTAAAAFRTLAGAISFAMGRYGPGGKPIVLRLGLPGTYANSSLPAGSSLKIAGDSANPSNYTITNTNGLSNIACVNSYLLLTGVRLRNDVTARHVVDSAVGGVVDLDNVVFQTGPGTTQACVRAAYGGVVRLVGPVTFGANASNAIAVIGGSVNSVVGNDLVFSGNPQFADATISAANCGTVYLSGTMISGTALGSRFKSSTNAVIDTGGSGVNYLPGSAAGTVSAGGIYV